MKTRHIIPVLYLLFCCSHAIPAQVPIQITNYNHKNYKGGSQNWGITISPEHILYSGNNNGLLRYNGNDWTLLDPGERATVRAVRCINGRVYTAGDNNIGYWEYDTNGKITYTSLLPLANELGINGETFWSIGTEGRNIYFHSFGNILCYNEKGMSFLVRNNCYVSLYQTGDNLFTQMCGGPLQQIQDNKLMELYDASVFPMGETRFLFQLATDKFLIGHTNGKIYKIEDGKTSLFTQLENQNKVPVRIDCGDIWKDEILAVGTIGDGLFLIDLKEGEQRHIHSSQLQDFNVHGLSFANKNSLWLSLDNGISSITLNPETYLWKTHAEIGTFFDAANFNGKTYIATNQGIYFYEDNGKKMQTPIFPLQFCHLKNELLCGTTDQLYKMTAKQSSFTPFSNINGVRQFEYIANQGDEYLFLRSYSGVSLLQYKENTWIYLSSLTNTEDYAFIMPENLYTVWAIHPEKGIFRLRINKELNRVEGSDLFAHIDGYSNYNRINLVKVEEKILFATPKGMYLFDIAEKSFRKQNHLSMQISHPDKLQSAKTAYKNNIWVVAKDELFLYQLDDLSAGLIMHHPFAGNELMLYDKHYNLTSIGDSLTFVSTSDGTVVIDNNS